MLGQLGVQQPWGLFCPMMQFFGRELEISYTGLLKKTQCVINSPSGKKWLLVFIAGLTQNLSVSKLLWEKLVKIKHVEIISDGCCSP